MILKGLLKFTFYASRTTLTLINSVSLQILGPRLMTLKNFKIFINK